MTARGRYQVTRVLLRRGATEDLRDNNGEDAADYARKAMGKAAAAPAIALLADFRAAGGTWKKYVLVPRQRMLALRVLCEMGRASAPDGPAPSARVGLLPASSQPPCPGKSSGSSLHSGAPTATIKFSLLTRGAKTRKARQHLLASSLTSMHS